MDPMLPPVVETWGDHRSEDPSQLPRWGRPITRVFVRAVRLSAGFWRDPRGTTRRWRAEGIAPGRIEIDPPEPGTFKLYLLPDPLDPDLEAARLARTAHVD